jgi:hypothetical protein
MSHKNTDWETTMIYEKRVYNCVPGRMGVLLNRFADHTCGLFEKHGIRQAGFFNTLVGENHNQLTYLLAWESMAERELKWAAFVADPAWIAVRDASEKDGPILASISNQLLAPTAFSAVK